MDLIDAVQNDDFDMCEFMLKNGVNVHAEDDYAFQWAAKNGRSKMCSLLMEHGADVHAGNGSALQFAALNGYLEVCKLLIKQSHVQSHQYSLMWAAENGHFEICKLLLEHGVNVHADGDCALRWAAGKGHVEVCKLLLEHGADLKVLLTHDGDPDEIIYKLATEEQIKQAQDEWKIQCVMDS